ncbi:hypothetical protein BZA77DRAFT_247928, partial [Pyronema omphalodes]
MRIAEVWLLVTAVAAASPPTTPTSVPSGNSNTGASGAEVSNNLISDISPLLALFGERYTATHRVQSFSTSWVDSLLFAVAPLGIITAIVGAVRVAGPSWLRTLVGRARETRAAAEVELMSSTSHEVCEIWNGDAIVRVIGAPEIVELLYFEDLPAGWEECDQKQAGRSTTPDKEPQPTKLNASSEIQPMSQLDSEKGPSCESNVLGTTECLKYDLDPLNPYRNATLHSQAKNKKSPNISLNLSVSRNTRELYIATFLGILVQVVVLVIAGLVSYHPGWNLIKGGTLVQHYAYPLTSGGTILLVLGMFICAGVIDQSTKETIYEKSDHIKDFKLYLLWLQRGQLMGDETFESYAMIAKKPVEEIWTSSRQQPGEEIPVPSAVSAFATVGTFISISGFILQFIGLRGSHWVVSIAQLAATMLMTAVRALIRRRLSNQPVIVNLTNDFELEWLASAISTSPDTFGSSYSSLRAVKRPDPSETSREPAKDSLLDPAGHKVTQVRRRLGRLTQWKNPASGAAVSVANSMELVLNTLLQKSTESFTWDIDVLFNNKRQRVDLNVKNDGEKFRVSLAEIEALLSLWLQHVVVHEQKQQDREEGGKDEERNCKRENNRSEQESNSKTDNDRLKQEALKQNLRILGPHSNSLRQDLKWWLPSDSATVLRISKGERNQDGANHSESKKLHYSIDYHRIIGFSGTKDAIPESECDTVDFEYSVCSDQEDGATGNKSKSGHTDHTETENERFLAVISTTERELLFAQHIFTAFMLAIAPKITRIRGATKASQSMINIPTSWRNRQLGNEVSGASKLASRIKDTGLGSLEDAFLCIIPPLSIHDKLPSYAAVDEVAGFTSLHLAAKCPNFSICTMLLEKGADVNHKFPENGETVLHFAVQVLPTRYLELFLKHKADIDLRNNTGNTALELAVKEGYLD